MAAWGTGALVKGFKGLGEAVMKYPSALRAGISGPAGFVGKAAMVPVNAVAGLASLPVNAARLALTKAPVTTGVIAAGTGIVAAASLAGRPASPDNMMIAPEAQPAYAPDTMQFAPSPTIGLGAANDNRVDAASIGYEGRVTGSPVRQMGA